jgi:hypothetical protein
MNTVLKIQKNRLTKTKSMVIMGNSCFWLIEILNIFLFETRSHNELLLCKCNRLHYWLHLMSWQPMYIEVCYVTSFCFKFLFLCMLVGMCTVNILYVCYNIY